MAKLSPVFIELGLQGQNKVHVISELVDKLHQKGCLFEKKQYLDAVLAVSYTHLTLPTT